MRRPLFPVAFAVAGALTLSFFAAAPASAATVTVTTWPELKAAFLVDGDTVVLGQNITATGVEFLTVEAGESVTLDLAGFDLAIDTSGVGSDPAIHVSPTSTLTIAGTGGGTLIATGSNTSAGVGGRGSNSAGGTVIINGGTVTATGGRFGAGIGAGRFGTGGTTTINGGTVTATGGGSRAAGIGGGANSGAGGITTITGGTVTATGGPYAAGIGGASVPSSGAHSQCTAPPIPDRPRTAATGIQRRTPAHPSPTRSPPSASDMRPPRVSTAPAAGSSRSSTT